MDNKLRGKLLQQLEAWRNDLINLSRTNRLLYFRHTKTASLEIEGTTSDSIVQRLARSAPNNFWKFYLPPEPADGQDSVQPVSEPQDWELVVQGKTTREVESALRLLERKANQEFVDKGLWTLYLGLGFLEWIDADVDKRIQSPLLLVPVSFSRESLREPFQLRGSEDDAVINPALALKLVHDFGVELPALEDVTEVHPSDVMAAVRTAVHDQGVGQSMIE